MSQVLQFSKIELSNENTDMRNHEARTDNESGKLIKRIQIVLQVRKIIDNRCDLCIA